MKHLSIFFVALLVTVSACKPKDEDLTKAVQAAISTVSSDVTVSTQDGVATLSGAVENQEVIQKIVTLAEGTKGIKSVVNSMTVKVQEIVFSADDILKQKVEAGFAKYGLTGITATVTNGEVTLTGDIARAKLMDAMKAANEALPMKVTNQLTIK